MSFRLIEAERAQHRVSRLCQVLGVTRAGYYAWKRRPRSRRAGPTTTARAREAPAAADLVRRDFRASGPDRLWVADITYVPTWEGYVFLACVLDAWSRKVVGWSMREDLKAELALDALGMALTRRRPRPGLVHHSDRGRQYTSLAFGKTMQAAGVLPSMGRRGDAFDNALAESFFATLETELLERHSFRSRDEARLGLFTYIEGFYNPPPAPLDARLPQPGPLRRGDDQKETSDSRRGLKLRCQRKRGNST